MSRVYGALVTVGAAIGTIGIVARSAGHPRSSDLVIEGGFLIVLAIAGTIVAGNSGKTSSAARSLRKLSAIDGREDWTVDVEIRPGGRTAVTVSGPWPEARPGWVHHRTFEGPTTDAAVRAALAAWKGAR